MTITKGLTILFYLTVSFYARAQETKQVQKEKDGNVEAFYVLKSDKGIKQGPYEKYIKYSNPMTRGLLLTERGQYDNNRKTGAWTFYWGENNIVSKGSYNNDLKTGTWEYYKDGTVIEKGEYKNGLREGLWVYFDKGLGIIERGSYSEGAKIGKWYYYYDNILAQTYDYSLDSVLQHVVDKGESEVFLDSTSETVKVVLSRPPQYVGFKRQLQTDMSTLTKYPLEARRLVLEGKVVVGFVVNIDGTISDITVVKDIGGNCGIAVISAFKANSVKWIPGIYEGRKVKVKYYQTVSFQLTIDLASALGQSTIVYE